MRKWGVDMNTLDELIYYCEEKEPVGALMLIGEWGCGKTYLIEHELSNTLKESHIIIRVSLFGISSVEAVAAIVKQSWTDASLNDKGTVGAWVNKARQFKEKLAPLAKANETTDAIFSLSASDFVTISNTIGDKTVVLVFDDLERSRLDAVDLLGAITVRIRSSTPSSLPMRNACSNKWSRKSYLTEKMVDRVPAQGS